MLNLPFRCGLKNTLDAQRFDFLILFVTGLCNARCRHCFYWKNIGPEHTGPSLDEVKQIAQSMPTFRILLLSGGEPTLRRDLPQIIEIFRQYNHIETVDIPTNGLLPGRIEKIAYEALVRNPELRHVSFNLSIDGFAQTHDHIRGIDGSFDSAFATASQLKTLKADFPNLRLVINSVICAENYDEIVGFAHYVHKQDLFDNHFFEIVRGEPRDARVKNVPPEKLRRIYEEVLGIQENYLRRNKWSQYQFPSLLWRPIADMGRLIYQYLTQWKVYSQGSRWNFPCQAGEALGVIDYDGSMRVCELRKARVDLENFGFDFNRAIQSPSMLSERKSAKSHQCDCTHVCFLVTSFHRSIRARIQSIWLYLRYKIFRRCL
jgi:MoaA/NifB/PqqE/SkfB family radical SAM enzyme